MKMKKKTAVSVSLGLIAAALAAAPMHVTAAGTGYTPGLTSATDGTDPVSINTTSFDKYLVMDVNANVPNATFDFSIDKYDSTKDPKAVLVDAAEGNLAIINGVTAQSSGTLDFKAGDAANTGSAAAGEVKFVVSDPTVTEGASGADTAVDWQDAASGNEKYAKKKLTLDFSTVQFTEPGVYRYLITETGTNQGISNDTGVTGANNTYRTLDVYVEDYADYYANLSDNTGYTAPTGKELFIAGYVLYEGKHDDAPSATATSATPKSTSYTNAYTSYDLTFSKTVTGNQGSKDKYFAFTVKIENAVAGAVYDVSYENADQTISANPNAATTCITADVTQPAKLYMTTDGTSAMSETNTGVTTKEFTFYLQHGQSIEIKGLAEGTKYTVTEAPEDYSPSAAITGDTLTGDGTGDGTLIALADNAMSDDYIKDDTVIDFTNNRQGVIPTGILSTLAGSLGLTAVGVAGIAGCMFCMKKKKKSGADEKE